MDCPASSIWSKVQDCMKDTLRESTLEDLVSTPRRNGRVSNPVGGLEAGSLAAAPADFRTE
jgi:DNA-binding IscR family transcriptional regulator